MFAVHHYLTKIKPLHFSAVEEEFSTEGRDRKEVRLLQGDCLKELSYFPDNSMDSIVTDPPYGIKFLNKKWDYSVPAIEVWKECLRVLKPGGRILSFGGTKTQHRMACNIEDAGFEICDVISWVYGSGFPKNLNISKGIDKLAGAERKVIGVDKSRLRPNRKYKSGAIGNVGGNESSVVCDRTDNGATLTAPATQEAEQWDGWGTALKPAMELITVARKPLAEKTIVQNVLKYGTGGINIDACRVSAKGDSGGRWPANLLHDGSDEVVELFPNSTSNLSKRNRNKRRDTTQYCMGGDYETREYGDKGSAARFFYCAKTSKKEKGECNNHPTVKPIMLMRYLVRLVTPKEGIVLDPFMGSGSTGIAAVLEGFKFVGVELDEGYYKIAVDRIEGSVPDSVK